MPLRCSVPGCKTNYNSSIKNDGAKSVFTFPKNDDLREKWIKAIPRQDWTPSKFSAVCELHFHSNDIIRIDKRQRPDGTIWEGILSKPVLKKTAVPSIFPNLPKYLSREKQIVRTDPESRRQKQIAQHEILVNDFEKSDIINENDFFLQFYMTKLNIPEMWNIKCLSDKIVFYTLNLDTDIISIEYQLLINKDLTVKIFVQKNELTFNDLKWILNFDMKISRWSQVQNLLDRYKYACYNNEQKGSIQNLLVQATHLLNKALCLTESDDTFVYSKQLNIIIDQIVQISRLNRKYSASTIIMSFMLYIQSVR